MVSISQDVGAHQKIGLGDSHCYRLQYVMVSDGGEAIEEVMVQMMVRGDQEEGEKDGCLSRWKNQTGAADARSGGAWAADPDLERTGKCRAAVLSMSFDHAAKGGHLAEQSVCFLYTL